MSAVTTHRCRSVLGFAGLIFAAPRHVAQHDAVPRFQALLAADALAVEERHGLRVRRDLVAADRHAQPVDPRAPHLARGELGPGQKLLRSNR